MTKVISLQNSVEKIRSFGSALWRTLSFLCGIGIAILGQAVVTGILERLN